MKPLRVEERHNSFSVDEQSHEAEKSSTKTSSTAKGRVWLDWVVWVIIGSVKRHLFRKRRWESVKQKNVQTTRRSRNYFPAGDSRHSINSGMNTSLRMASHALNGLSSSAVFIDAMCVLDVVIALHQTSAPDWRNNRVNNNQQQSRCCSMEPVTLADPWNSLPILTPPMLQRFRLISVNWTSWLGPKFVHGSPLCLVISRKSIVKNTASLCASVTMAVKETSSVTWSFSRSRCCECSRFIFVSRGSSFDLCWHRQRIKTSPPFSKGPRFPQIFTCCTLLQLKLFLDERKSWQEDHVAAKKL